MKIGILVLPGAEKPSLAAEWLSRYIRAMGAEPLPEVLEKLPGEELVREKLAGSDGLVLVGGAGKTEVVRAVAAALGLDVEVNEEALQDVRAWFMDEEEPPSNLEEMALMPEFSYPVGNPRGPVDGFVALSLEDDRFVAATPPGFAESIEVFEAGIQDFVRKGTGKRFSATFSFQLALGVEKARRLAEEVDAKFPSVFARLDGRFTDTGVPLVCTVYAGSPEELGALHDEVKRFVEERAGGRILESHGARGGGELA